MRQIPPRHLQGFAPTTDPLPIRQSCYICRPSDPLLSFHSCGLSFDHPSPAFAAHPLMTLPSAPQVTPTANLQRVTGDQPSLLSPEVLPVRALRPSLAPPKERSGEAPTTLSNGQRIG